MAAAAGVRALDDVDLDIGDGEFVALLGPSGCGKSTLLNLLAGFEPPSERAISRFDGAGDRKPGPDRGVVFQEAALLPWLTVWENVDLRPAGAGPSRAPTTRRRRAPMLISSSGSRASATRCRRSSRAACASASASPACW